MNIRKFFAGTCREALRRIREDIGPDAVILSNRSVDGGVEIVALAGPDLERLAVPGAHAMPPAPSAPAASVVASAATDDAAAPARLMQHMRDELQTMRGLLENQVAALLWGERQRRTPMQGELMRALLGAGFSAQLAGMLLERLATQQASAPASMDLTQGLAWVKSALMRNLPVMDSEDALMNEGGVYALMGPTGVGKTTTTAKLAARCVMRHGAGKLALLTTDSYRIGGHEQLRIYGRILGVTVHAVKDATDLRLALAELRDKHMVLIDTVGMSQRDRTVAEQVAMLRGADTGSDTPVRRLLLLNASSHGDTLNEVVHAYRAANEAGAGEHGGLAGCILTKLDEATNLGAALDAVIRHQLPVHYVSTGQRVPEHLHVADRQFLVDTALAASRPPSPFVPERDDLPALVGSLGARDALGVPSLSGEACFG